MNKYLTSGIIKKLREKKGITQQQLAEILDVSEKTVSKWETGRGYPDITLVEGIASALGISVIELFSGENVINSNKSFNMKRVKFYICPVCGNIICGIGESIISCCGICLPALEPEESDESHKISIVKDEDEYYVSIDHSMDRKHYISFIAAIRYDGYEIVKLYPEGGSEARFKIHNTCKIYCYCNHHGLFQKTV